ncbi:unnamed protein product [Paramecium pentaurelia]|uniref:Uncharacterized protein n=1 Tax=Paramecium pentaurelia TaxID=43138 RepID=A0A8S1XZ78_9CILI|nr:unnamed protein product [Paramecium pentaurelia]
MNDIEIIKGQDILKFAQEMKKVNVNALLWLARQEQILLSDHQLEEIRKIESNHVLCPKQDENRAKDNQSQKENIYRFLSDVMDTVKYEVAIVMKLQLTSKMCQEEISKLNYQNIKKEDDNYIIKNLQKMFENNIGISKNVFLGELSNRRNRISEQFNEAKKEIMNNLKDSEKDKIYQSFLQKISLKDYKKIWKANLRVLNVYEALQNLQQQKKEKLSKRWFKFSGIKYEKPMKKLLDIQQKELSNDSPILIQMAQNKKL